MGRAILFVLTNIEYIDPGETSLVDGFTEISAQHRTGFDIKEVALAYHALHIHRGLEINLASPDGGPCPIDPGSLKAAEQEEEVQAFLADECARNWLKCTDRLGAFDTSRFQAVLFLGGPGAMVDYPACKAMRQIVKTIYDDARGVVGAIGHGTAALLNMAGSVEEEQFKGMETRNWLKGRIVTGNTVEEDIDMRLEKVLPFSVERRLRESGAKFKKGKKFSINVVVDERLITAQNRNSTREWLQVLTDHLH